MSCECRTIQLGSCRPVACKAVSGGAIVTLVESWEPTELGVLERAAKVRSFALDAAWSEAAVSSHYASSQSLALREGGSLRAVSVGLRRSKAGFSKVVCGTNGGVGIVADEPHAAEILLRAMWNRWRPSEMEVFGSKIIPATRLTWAPSFMRQFILAKQDGRTIAAVHVLGARGIASWWKGGATEEGYSLNAPTVAMATAIQVAAKHGFDTFDMGGTHPTDPKYRGIHLYKSSFGGRLVETFLGHRSTMIARTARRLTPVNL